MAAKTARVCKKSSGSIGRGQDQPIEGLGRVASIREFDDIITAPYCGFRDADDYYSQSSALRVIATIRIPTLILAAQDDPMVPFRSFRDGALASNPNVTLVAPKHGGHCGFISRTNGPERFWAEARVVEFCRSHSRMLC